MKTRKIPMRKCLITQEQFPKSELTRIVCSKDKVVSVDLTSRLNGRGAYIKLTKDNVLKAQQRKLFEREFSINQLDDVYQTLLELAHE